MRVELPPLKLIAPPLVALLKDMIVSAIARSPPKLRTAPPLEAELFVNVQPLELIVPLLSIAPPVRAAELFLKQLPLIFTAPEL